MTRAEQAEGIAQALASVLADAGRVGFEAPAGLYDLAAARWVSGAGVPPSGFPREGLVVRVAGSDHLLSRGAAASMIEVVEFVQDQVIDELGKGWPELLDAEGGFRTVLAAALRDGVLVWRGNGRNVAVVGRLGLPKPG